MNFNDDDDDEEDYDDDDDENGELDTNVIGEPILYMCFLNGKASRVNVWIYNRVALSMVRIIDVTQFMIRLNEDGLAYVKKFYEHRKRRYLATIVQNNCKFTGWDEIKLLDGCFKYFILNMPRKNNKDEDLYNPSRG